MDNTLHNEFELVQQLSTGNTEAFRKLFDHYRNRIYNFIVNLVHREEIAEELVQDVFLKIWTSRASLGVVENFGAFLYTVARNRTFTHMKRMAHEKQILVAIAQSAIVHTDDEIIYRDYQRILQQAIDSLPAQQKAVYILSREKGLNRREIAEALNISPNTVKAHMAAATQYLRNWFAGYVPEMLLLFMVLHC